MELSPKSAPAELIYRGKTYCFCADTCRKVFEADPGKHIPPSPSAWDEAEIDAPQRPACLQRRLDAT